MAMIYFLSDGRREVQHGLPVQRAGDSAEWQEPPMVSDLSRPLAQALEIEKGEVIEWVVEDKHRLVLKRTPRPTEAAQGRRRAHE